MKADLYDVGYWKGKLWCSDHQCVALTDAVSGRDNLNSKLPKGSKRAYLIRRMQLRYIDD